jgi:hypothetical protein
MKELELFPEQPRVEQLEVSGDRLAGVLLELKARGRTIERIDVVELSRYRVRHRENKGAWRPVKLKGCHVN